MTVQEVTPPPDIDSGEISREAERCCHTIAGSGGELYYNSITSPLSVNYSAMSDGTTNLIELVPPNSLLGVGSSTDWRIDPYNAGRLQYRGGTARRVLLTATVMVLPGVNSNLICAIYRNANTILNASRVFAYAWESVTCQTLVVVQPGDFFSIVTGDLSSAVPSTAGFNGFTITAIAI